MIRTLVACIALLAASGAAAQILECFDAKGNRTVAQFCPPGTVKENRLMKSGAGGTPPGAQTTKSTAEKEVEFRKRALERQESEAKADKEKTEAKANEQNCLDARSQLRQLEDGGRIMRTDPRTGERSYLSDADRAGEIAKAKKGVESWCK